jgi:hypothetical protein
MKKLFFILSIFTVSGLLIFLLMRGGGDEENKRGVQPQNSSVLVKMVDSIKVVNWVNGEQFKLVRSTILLSKSNGNIDDTEKERLLSTLDINYGFSLNKKYNDTKYNFSVFPSTLYAEMSAFQTKYKDLAVGISELNAFSQLTKMDGSVNLCLNGRYNFNTIKNLVNRINEIKLGALVSNSNCLSIKQSYLSKLRVFENDIKNLDPLIDIANADVNNENFSEYRPLAYNKPILKKYTFYRNWLSQNESKLS